MPLAQAYLGHAAEDAADEPISHTDPEIVDPTVLLKVEAALGGRHHLARLLLGDVLAVHGAAQHSHILRVAQGVFGLLELDAGDGAGFHQRGQPFNGEAGAEHVGVFGTAP